VELFFAPHWFEPAPAPLFNYQIALNISGLLSSGAVLCTPLD